MGSIVTASIGIVVASFILYLVRKDRLHVRHGLVWILIAVAFAIFGLYPSLIDGVASRLGIGYPPILGVTLALAFLVIKILVMDIERARLESRNQRLIQRLAILEAELGAPGNIEAATEDD